MSQAQITRLEPFLLDYNDAKKFGEEAFLTLLRSQMKSKISEQGISDREIKRSVYVVRLHGAFLIRYRTKNSPVLYIGRGDAQTRLASHLKKWMHHIHNFGGDTTVDIRIILPRRQNMVDFYKHVEGSMLKLHKSTYGSLPLMNGERLLSVMTSTAIVTRSS